MNKFLKIKSDSNSKIIFICLSLTAFFGTASYPTITKFLVTELPARWLAFEEIVTTLSLVVICQMWNNENFRHKSIPLFLYIYLVEMVGILLVLMYCIFVEANAWVLAVGSLFVTSIVSVWLSRIIIAFKSILFKERDREDYDNNHELVYSIAAFIGSVISLIFNPNLVIALVLWAVATLGDIGWLLVYFKNKNKLIDKSTLE